MAKKKTATGTAAPTFEEALSRLEAIVRELEETDLPLERSLSVFEEGVRLSRLLHERLNEAERKVEILLKSEDGEKIPVPFPAAAEKSVASAATDVEDAAADGDDGEDGEDDEEKDTGGRTPGGHGQISLL